jgi:hypothetical protein
MKNKFKTPKNLICFILLACALPFSSTAQGPNFKDIFQKAAQLPAEERDAFIQKEIHIHNTEVRITEFTEQVDQEYTPFFKEMGLTEEQIETFKKLRVDLLRLAIEDGDPRMEFISNRHAYDLDIIDTMDQTYLKRLESHPLTKRLPHTVNASIWTKDNDKEYESLYMSCGISKAHIEDFKIKRRNLHQEAESLIEPRENLIKTRETYLGRLKNVAGEKAFESYKRWELTKQAQRIFNMIKARTTEINLELLQKNEPIIVELLREANVQLSHDWNCPFGPLPSPMVSQKLMGLDAQKDLPLLEESRDTFFAAARSYQLPESLLLELHGFFMEQINHLQVFIDSGRDLEQKIKFDAFE